jgi:Na+/melibiose symporter-like transporter
LNKTIKNELELGYQRSMQVKNEVYDHLSKMNGYALGLNSKPAEGTAFSSLMKTFRNKDFRMFVGSDILYWIGLTMFQTGLPFLVTSNRLETDFLILSFLLCFFIICNYLLFGRSKSNH